jgi:hypothetical protein
MTEARPSGGGDDRAHGRPWLFALAAVSFAFAVPALVFDSLDDFGVEKVEVGLDVIDSLTEALPELALGNARGSWDVAFLGDSMVVSYPPGRTVPARLEQAIEQTRGPRPLVEVVSVAAPGMGPFDYYFIADLIAEAKPDQVILPFNLAALSNPWRGTFSRPELSGWLSPARLPAALSLPLEWVGLTTDRMLVYVAIVQSGAAEPWHALIRQQARLGRALTIAASRLDKQFRSTAVLNFGTARFRYADEKNIIDAIPSSPGVRGKRKRLTAFGLRQRFGPALDGIDPDNPVVRVLAAAVARFQQDGIPVLVYANPTNTANLQEAGVLDEQGLARTLDVIATAVRAAGGEFVDLHRLLPDEGFRDAAGHFNVRAHAPDGPEMLGQALVPFVIEEARAQALRAAGGDG